MIMKTLRERERRDVDQQVVESVVEKVGYLNGDEVANILKPYNAEMTTRDVDEATRLKYFCRVVAVSIHKDVRELQEAHKSWVSFKKDLFAAHGYEKRKGRDRPKFDQWVASVKGHQSTTQEFLEFQRHYAPS